MTFGTATQLSTRRVIVKSSRIFASDSLCSSSTPGPPEVRGGGAEDDLHGVSLHDAGPQDLQTTLREQTPQEPHPSRTAGSFDGFP